MPNLDHPREEYYACPKCGSRKIAVAVTGTMTLDDETGDWEVQADSVDYHGRSRAECRGNDADDGNLCDFYGYLWQFVMTKGLGDRFVQKYKSNPRHWDS